MRGLGEWESPTAISYKGNKILAILPAVKRLLLLKCRSALYRSFRWTIWHHHAFAPADEILCAAQQLWLLN